MRILSSFTSYRIQIYSMSVLLGTVLGHVLHLKSREVDSWVSLKPGRWQGKPGRWQGRIARDELIQRPQLKSMVLKFSSGLELMFLPSL